VSLKGEIAFKIGLYFLGAHVDELEHDLFILVFEFFVEELFERPVLLFE
jgi:hypothetical protein